MIHHAIPYCHPNVDQDKTYIRFIFRLSKNCYYNFYYYLIDKVYFISHKAIWFQWKEERYGKRKKNKRHVIDKCSRRKKDKRRERMKKELENERCGK